MAKRSTRPARRTVRLVIRLNEEANRKLGVITAMEGITRHQFIESAVMDRGRRYVVSDRPRPEDAKPAES